MEKKVKVLNQWKKKPRTLYIPGESKTMQEFEPETNITKLMERYKSKKEIEVVVPSSKSLMYGDFSGEIDFKIMNNFMIKARQSFMELPSKVRSRFGNDPVEFIKFCNNDENKSELEKLGIKKEVIPEPEPQKVFVVNEKTEESTVTP